MNQLSLPYDMKIGETVQSMVLAGVAVSVIFDKTKDMRNGPQSLTTFYKLYRKDIVAARAQLHQAIGSAIMEKALADRDMKALELVAKTKLGWSEKLIVEEQDPNSLDENTSAIDDLLAKLNLKGQSNGDAE
jgi:hypothetical protein